MLYAKWISGHYLNFMTKQPLVDENRFRYAGIETAPLPTFEQARQQVPAPFWDGHQEATIVAKLRALRGEISAGAKAPK